VARRLASLLVGVVLVLAGCSRQEPTLPSGFVTGTSLHTINVGGRDRTYRLYKPAGLSASASLVVMLHGGFANAQQAERSYGRDQLADSAKFVLSIRAYPDGFDRAWNVNGGGCCGPPARQGVDDVAFITAAVADIGRNVSIDSSFTQKLWEFFAAHPA
jgi:polyhydroxybutyrate depolymerase